MERDVMNYLHIAGSSALVYIFMLFAIRIFGKKEIAQLSIIDLVFFLLISNAVQSAMIGSDTSLFGGLCAAGTLFAIDYVFKYILYRFPKLSNIVQGNAIMLVYEGKIIKENLVKSRISVSEIEEAAREHGVKSIEDIDLAILEINGNISVLSDEYKKRTKVHPTQYKGRDKIVSYTNN
jgi:uncharacterized membrane protein YcaP (DUF421 family)